MKKCGKVTINGGMRSRLSIYLGLTALISVCWSPLISQEGPQRVYMYLNYFQDEASQVLDTELKYREEGKFYPLTDVEVEFTVDTDSNSYSLGKVMTNEHGKGILDLNGLDIARDTSGFAHFMASFNGNEQYKRASRDLSVQESVLTMSYENMDSTRTLTVEGEVKDDDVLIPMEDVDVVILVERLFGELPVGEGTIDDGTFTFAFPSGVPGDQVGDLNIIARIVDHDELGTVSVQDNVGWGDPVSYARTKVIRALWSRAPIWLMFAVSIVLLAVWYQYFLAVSKLFRLRKL